SPGPCRCCSHARALVTIRRPVGRRVPRRGHIRVRLHLCRCLFASVSSLVSHSGPVAATTATSASTANVIRPAVLPVSAAIRRCDHTSARPLSLRPSCRRSCGAQRHAQRHLALPSGTGAAATALSRGNPRPALVSLWHLAGVLRRAAATHHTLPASILCPASSTTATANQQPVLHRNSAAAV
ncbi:hypothetical protein HK405_000290, partial [Cladochytrium tenue]